MGIPEIRVREGKAAAGFVFAARANLASRGRGHDRGYVMTARDRGQHVLRNDSAVLVAI